VKQEQNRFIVAIGSSAGGLKPMQTFFDSTPNDHATYIIVRHLQQDFRSLMADILKKHSKLEICEATNGVLIEQDKIYLQPSKMYMTIDGDHLYLQPRNTSPLYPNLSVDIFLKSLADAKGDEGIAVILSGRGSDGTKGASLVKQAGGMVIVQEPKSCDYNSMPLSVINSGFADYQLLPEEMPNTILNHINKWIRNNKEK
jgi:two-component system CheB/CheR fusion protein